MKVYLMLIIGRKDVTSELIANAESPVSRCVSTGPVIIFEFDINYLQTVSIQYYYIDRCDYTLSLLIDSYAWNEILSIKSTKINTHMKSFQCVQQLGMIIFS